MSTPVAVALLHGFTGAPASWDPVTRLLPQSWSVLRPPLCGHGFPARSISGFDDEVDRLAAVLRESASSCSVAGYSLGARLALRLLVRHPRLVRGAVLIGVNPGLDSELDRAARREADERLALQLETEGIRAFVEHWESLPLFASQAVLPTTVLDAQRAARLARDPDELARSLRTLGLGAMPSMWSALPTVVAPVAVVAGEHDAKFRELGERAARLLPRGRLHVVPSAGHNAVLEAPDRVADILRSAVEASAP